VTIKNFDTSARRGGSQTVANAVDIVFAIDGEELTAHPPTTGQLALFMNRGGNGGMVSVNAVFDFLEAVLDEDDFFIIETKLAEGVELEMLVDVVTYLIETWSTRPTSRSKGSSPSRKTTGPRSTAKPRPRAKTAST
jgi:hypothetical protein